MRNEKDDKMRKEDVSWTLTHPLFIFSYSFFHIHFFIFISNFSFLISHFIVFLIVSPFSFLMSSWAGNGASHNARCGTEVRSEPQLDNSAGIASRDINAANYDQ